MGIKTLEEANPEHYHNHSMASQFCPPSSRLYRRTRQGVFQFHQRGGSKTREQCLGERLPFNTVCGEYLNNSAGWIHGCAFSPSGNALAFTAHDSSITLVYPRGPDQPPNAVISVSTQLLPFLSLIWNGESEIIAAGYVCMSLWLRFLPLTLS